MQTVDVSHTQVFRKVTCLLASLYAQAMIAGCTSSASPITKSTPVKSPINAPAVDSQTHPELPKIKAFCGHCHAFPEPDTFARHEWKAEVDQGFNFFAGTEESSLEVPSEDAVIAFYEAQAPEGLPSPEPQMVEVNCRLQRLSNVDETAALAISELEMDSTRGKVWACDMKTSTLLASTGDGKFVEVARPIVLSNPCRLTFADMNQDGQSEMLVSDLGSFFPADHQNGSVWSLDPANEFQATNVLQGVSRVSDVQAGDLDGDGDLDLVIAEFGWRRTGRVLILWNEPRNTAEPWKQQILDSRHGAVDVPLVDLNQDGKLDIVVLLSQEFEIVLAYLNQGNGEFQPNTIFDAANPSFGSSGMQLVDFDRDGDVDVVHSNGDSFDSSYAKPFHGIRWLENQGQFPFAVHEVAQLAGVHRAVAGDIDLDGDLDLVAVALLAPVVLQQVPSLPSVIWIEQTTPGKFAVHVAETDLADHASCLLHDFDNDGDLDLLASNFRSLEEPGPAVTIFRNTTR